LLGLNGAVWMIWACCSWFCSDCFISKSLNWVKSIRVVSECSKKIGELLELALSDKV